MSDSSGEATLPDAPAPVLEAMPEVVDQVALAKLSGEPLFAMPPTCTSRRMRWKCSWRPSKARWTCCCT